MLTMVPSSIMGTRASWALPRELALRVMFLKPILWISSMTMQTTRSPSRKWWWKETVMPSWALHLTRASWMSLTILSWSLRITGVTFGLAFWKALPSL